MESVLCASDPLVRASLTSRLKSLASVVGILLSDLEIEGGKLDPFTCKKLEHIIVEALGIDCFDALEIVIAVFVPGSILAVYEIVIKSYGVGLKAEGSELYGKSV